MYSFSDGMILCDSCTDGESMGWRGFYFLNLDKTCRCEICSDNEIDGFEGLVEEEV